MNRLPHILSTRTLTSQKVNTLHQQGWTFTCHDFIDKVIAIPADLMSSSMNKDIAITSITGVKAFLQISHRFQLDISSFDVHCISGGTREYALASGLNIKSAATSALALADEIVKHADVKSVTHICSTIRREELSERLKTAGITVYDVIAYRTTAKPVWINHAYDAILFFSPSAVNSFLSSNVLHQVPCFCIGQTTANHARHMGYHQIYSAEAPSEDILLQTVINHYSKIPAHAKE